MPLCMKVTKDPHKLIGRVLLVDEGTPDVEILLWYNGRRPTQRTVSQSRAVKMYVREDDTEREAVVEFSGLPFPKDELVSRITVIRRPD